MRNRVNWILAAEPAELSFSPALANMPSNQICASIKSGDAPFSSQVK
jgi:hypothetical protein